MTDRHWADQLRISIARLLRQVEILALDLHAQALNDSNARDFPGGTALHMLGPAASSEAWERQYSRKETLERFDPDTGADRWEGPISPKTGYPTSNDHDPAIYQFEDDAAEHPINVLESWTRIIREERDQPTSLAPTLSREVDYLRKNIDWMTRADEFDQPEWPPCFDLGEELRLLVRRMENVLREGDRIDTDAAPCFQTDLLGVRCGGTLARVNYAPRPCEHTLFGAHGMAFSPAMRQAHKACNQGGRDDLYRCLACEKIYTESEYWLAVREHMEREAG